ncbi:MAG: OmpA family protein [bacterium]|nr:OmpA family protein [bacterium]
MKRILSTICPIIICTGLLLLLVSCARNVNYSEHSPTISPDGNMLIYQSNRDSAKQFKVYIKYKTPLGWSLPFPLLFANSNLSTAGPFITYDQNNLLLTAYRDGKTNNVDIWISERTQLVWGPPVPLGPPVNTSGYEGFASLSPNGKTLYFVRECSDKEGYKDDKFCIFSSVKRGKNWSTPVRLPYPVNTKNSEFGPVILADGKTLVFSSSRKGGFGGYDLYKSERNSLGRWSKPVNLGSKINTPFDDRIASIPASGDIMYYSRPTSKDGKIFRIETVPIPRELQHASVVSVSGTVSDKKDSGKLLYSEITITDVKRDISHVIWSNKKDGSYHIILNKGTVYDVSVSSKGYTFYSSRFDLKSLKKFNTITRDIGLEPISSGATIILNNLYFSFNSAGILPESKYELTRLVSFMKQNPGIAIEIGGHTDSVGSKDSNMKLSQKRARSVFAFLVKKGIAAARLKAKGYGFSIPLKDGEPGKNRRVEINIVSR